MFTPGFTRLALLGKSPGESSPFAYGAITLFDLPFQDSSARTDFCNSLTRTHPGLVLPRPRIPNACMLADIRFGLFPFRSPLLGESRFLSSPGGTKMFQFSPLTSVSYAFRYGCRGMTRDRLPHSEIPGSKPGTRLPGAYRSYPTSFIAISCQGIHQKALVA